MKHGTNISFWKFLEELGRIDKLGRIDIPRIQRDYVQGVKDGTGLEIKGQRLVDAVLDAAKEGNLLVLDFIYGVINNGVFYPLDGQQRLTLLWLLHWYLALRCGKLKEEKVKEELKKFTYSTRSSSKQFMSLLLDPKFEYDIFHKVDIDKQIEARSWFYTGWHNDPTIASMLVVLRRIDEKFPKKSDDADIENIWDRLTGDKSNLLFHYLDLEQYAKPDDLFIKMNARGKLLEPLDNFKSDLINHLKKGKYDDEKQEWISKYDDEKKEWIRNFNGKWIELFWGLCNIEKHCTGMDEKSIPPSADSLFYRFICRLFIDRLILIKSKKAVNKIADSDIWENLYSAERGGKYSTLDPFIGKDPEPSNVNKKEEDGEDDLLDRSMRDIEEIMKNLTNGVNIISEINKWAKPYWTEKNNEEYIPSGHCEAGALSNNNRPIFHAIVSFIRLVPIEDKGIWESMFKAWMRFVWNIHENSGSHAFSLTRSIEKYANELLTKLESTNQFYERLAGINIEPIEKNAETQLEWQVQEEIEKAYFRIKDENKDFIKVLESIEEDFEGQIYVFYKDDRKASFPIDRNELKDRYAQWNIYKGKQLRDKTKSLLQRFCNPDELIRFEFPKEGEINLYNGKKLINHYPEICLRLLRDEPYKWTKENHILEALLDSNGSNNLLEITEKHGRNSRYRFSKDWDRYNLHMPYSGGWHIPMDQRSVKIGKMIQSLSGEWHNNWDTEWPDWIAGQPNDWKPKCNGFIYYDLTHWRTPIGKEREIYFYLFKNIFASHEITPSDIDDIINRGDYESWCLEDDIKKLEGLLKDICKGRIKCVRVESVENM